VVVIELLQQRWGEKAILEERYSPEVMGQVSHNEVKGEAQPGVV
jgi:hypothetical protein